MKVIVEKSTGLLKYAFDDTDTVVLGNKNSVMVDEDGVPKQHILDMNKTTAMLRTIESLPDEETVDEFVGNKYKLVGNSVILNEDFVPPPAPVEPTNA